MTHFRLTKHKTSGDAVTSLAESLVLVFAESFRAFFSESPQIEEEWRERLLAKGLLTSANRDRYL